HLSAESTMTDANKNWAVFLDRINLPEYATHFVSARSEPISWASRPDERIEEFLRTRNVTDLEDITVIIYNLRNLSALLSESDFLELRPPRLSYINRARSTGRDCTESFGRHSLLERVIGEPDFIQKDSNAVLRLVIEVKTKWALSANNLVTTYAQNLTERRNEITSPICVYNQLRQVFGYLSHNHLQFEALTTYDKTWFLYKQEPGSQDAGRSSRHRMPMAGWGRKGGKRNRVMARPNHPSNREEEHVPLEFFDWGSFRVFNVLGTCRTGTVFKAILHGELVALKICDLWQHPDYEKELLNEVEVYNALKDLQGDCVPRFKGAGYTAGGLFIIATDIVGRPLEDAESLSDQEYLVIQTALSSIHRHGFVHNDIRKENILIKRSSYKFYASFIDFAFSKQGCKRDFQKEMKSLARLLGQS
ncbi:17352_t:CDS:2, partial [Funneliformis caledonium]